VALKADAVEKGRVIPEQQRLLDSLAAENTLLDGHKKADRGLWAAGLPLTDVFREEADILFFPGCRYSYEQPAPALRSIIELLDRSGVKVGWLAEADNCCAGRAWQMGFFDEFKTRAERNIAAIQKSGVGMIVTPCADCRHALSRLYGPLGLDVEVLHISEYLDRLITDGAISFHKELDMTVTYHDPCHLGRQGEPYVPWAGKEEKILNQIQIWDPARPRYNGAHGIYEAPRNIIKKIPGVKLVEMERIREYAWCCGAGGGCSEIAAELSEWTAAERLDEASATGADRLITACPWCKQNFDSVSGNIQTMDILELVIAAL
jgi:Fe-S oxidoreductase